MKIIYKTILFLFTILAFGLVSCSEESVIDVKPEFQLSYIRDGQVNALAGTPIYIVRKGTAEFVSLYDGKPGAVYGEVGAKGVDFDRADSLGITYNIDGKYTVTLVSTSSAKLGAEVIRELVTYDVNVIDMRNSIKQFIVTVPELGVASQYVAGVFSNDSILISLPDAITNFKFKPAYLLDSDSAKVRVNNILQVANVTENDFNPSIGSLKYSVTADYGNVKNYIVQVKLVPSSNEKKLVKFEFGVNGKGEKGVIDQAAKTVTIKALTGTTLTGVRLVLQADNFTTIQIGRETSGVITYSNFSDRTAYNMTNTGTNKVKKIKVIAQNKTEEIYTVTVTN